MYTALQTRDAAPTRGERKRTKTREREGGRERERGEEPYIRFSVYARMIFSEENRTYFLHRIEFQGFNGPLMAKRERRRR